MKDDPTIDDALEDRDAAREIYQNFLDASTPHVLKGRAEEFCKFIALPFSLKTVMRTDVVETYEDLASDIAKIHTWLKDRFVSDYHRIARTARFLDADTVEGFHVTYALRGALPVIDPYTSRVILRRLGGMWKAIQADHELAGALYPGDDARAMHGAFSRNWSHAPDAITRDLNQAMPTYAAVMARMDKATMAEDFDAWIDQYVLPFRAHYYSHDTVIANADEARVFFDALVTTGRDLKIDSVVRAPSYAAFLSDTRLVGYHDTTLRRAGEVVYGPVHSRMLLDLIGGRWRCFSVTNGLTNTHHSGGGTEPTKKIPTIREIQNRMKR